MKTALWQVVLALSLLTTASGCYRATFYRDASVIRGDEHEEWTDFFVFGLVGTQDFDVHRFCPDGDVAVAQTGGNFGTGIVSVLTIGIYTPRKVYVTCASPGAAVADRRLEIALNRRGEPVHAEAQVGSRVIELGVATAGARSWRLSERNP